MHQNVRGLVVARVVNAGHPKPQPQPFGPLGARESLIKLQSGTRSTSRFGDDWEIQDEIDYLRASQVTR